MSTKYKILCVIGAVLIVVPPFFPGILIVVLSIYFAAVESTKKEKEWHSKQEWYYEDESEIPMPDYDEQSRDPEYKAMQRQLR